MSADVIREFHTLLVLRGHTGAAADPDVLATVEIMATLIGVGELPGIVFQVYDRPKLVESLVAMYEYGSLEAAAKR